MIKKQKIRIEAKYRKAGSLGKMVCSIYVLFIVGPHQCQYKILHPSFDLATLGASGTAHVAQCHGIPTMVRSANTGMSSQSTSGCVRTRPREIDACGGPVGISVCTGECEIDLCFGGLLGIA